MGLRCAYSGSAPTFSGDTSIPLAPTSVRITVGFARRESQNAYDGGARRPPTASGLAYFTSPSKPANSRTPASHKTGKDSTHRGILAGVVEPKAAHFRFWSFSRALFPRAPERKALDFTFRYALEA